MEAISVFEIFKIGIGPSSSHTLGPWNAALSFLKNMGTQRLDELVVELYGSLSKTGKGHATDKAIVLGLTGYNPAKIDDQKIPEIINHVKASRALQFNERIIPFDFEKDIIFKNEVHPLHPNTLIFKAFISGVLVSEEIYASVGGGFIESDSISTENEIAKAFPYPINKGQDLLEHCNKNNLSISEVVRANERSIYNDESIEEHLDAILDTMLDCVYQGCITEGILEGGLNVKRRAKDLCSAFTGIDHFYFRDDWIAAIKSGSTDFNSINKWISCFALAVNEQNAALSRVVTSPTNGAAGVIPAVILYYFFFCEYGGREKLRSFLLVAGEIGCLFKKGATISAAVGGCQAEIGVSSAMAAAGLTELMGGTAEQCLMAAEIAMEHHLGLTCDPIGGLVQVPCIERNAMGAIKAVTASNLALTSDPQNAVVNLDTVIKTMWDTAQDMNHKYKETSEGGLAFNLAVINPAC